MHGLDEPAMIDAMQRAGAVLNPLGLTGPAQALTQATPPSFHDLYGGDYKHRFIWQVACEEEAVSWAVMPKPLWPSVEKRYAAFARATAHGKPVQELSSFVFNLHTMRELKFKTLATVSRQLPDGSRELNPTKKGKQRIFLIVVHMNFAQQLIKVQSLDFGEPFG